MLKQKSFFWLVFTVFLLIILASTFNFRIGKTENRSYFLNSDFTAYLLGAKIVREGNITDLYNKATQLEYQNQIIAPYTSTELLSFRNPPIVALMYVPFTFLHGETAYRFFVVINVCLLIYCLDKILKNHQYNRILIILFVLFVPILATLIYGQIAIILLLVYCAVYFSLKKGEDSKAGFAASLLFIKPQHLIATPLFLIIAKDRAAYLKGLAPGLALSLLLNVALYGSSLVIDYPKFILESETRSLGTAVEENFSLQSVMQKFPNYSGYTVLISGFIYIIATVLLWKANLDTDIKFSLAIFFTALLGIHIMPSDFTIMLLPMALLTQAKYRRQYVPLVTGLYLIPLLGVVKLGWIVALALLLMSFAVLTL